MSFSRFTTRTLATLTLWAGFGLSAYAQLPNLTVDKAFEVKPRQPGVAIATPGMEQFSRFRIEPIANPKTPGSNMGFVLRDDQNRPVRQFVSYDNKSFNIVAFYTDGVESYREVFPPAATEPFQFRWLGSAGGKWGLDRDRDGKVDEWVVMSPEEASQELFQAVLTKDAKRLEALLATKESLEGTIGLPAPEVAKIKEKTAKAAQRLIAAAEELKLTPEAKWIHLETSPPHTTPADAFGGKDDLVIHKNATILIQDGKDAKLLQTGELVLVGRAWKVIEGPSVGNDTVASNDGGNGLVVEDTTKDIVAELDKLDKSVGMMGLPPDQQAAYLAKRAEILERIVKNTSAKNQPAWIKMHIDALASAGDSGASGNASHARLKQIAEGFKAQPQNPLAAYSAFRLLTTENSLSLRESKGEEQLKAAQEKWRVGLEAFVKAYPTSSDAPEAALRLAIAYEYAGREGEVKAKEWYDTIAKNYSTHPHAAKAIGAKKRLECEGKPIELVGPHMGSNQQFSVASLNGKVVVVYYWASWVSNLDSDVKKLKELLTTYGPKGLELVTICLDDQAATGLAAIKNHGLPGTHLHLPGGVDSSPLAASYGIHMPPHVFLIGKDTKVIDRNGQVLTLDGQLKSMFNQ